MKDEPIIVIDSVNDGIQSKQSKKIKKPILSKWIN